MLRSFIIVRISGSCFRFAAIFFKVIIHRFGFLLSLGRRRNILGTTIFSSDAFFLSQHMARVFQGKTLSTRMQHGVLHSKIIQLVFWLPPPTVDIYAFLLRMLWLSIVSPKGQYILFCFTQIYKNEITVTANYDDLLPNVEEVLLTSFRSSFKFW